MYPLGHTVTCVKAKVYPELCVGTAPTSVKAVLPSGEELGAAAGMGQGETSASQLVYKATRALPLRPSVLHTLHLPRSVYQVVRHSHI